MRLISLISLIASCFIIDGRCSLNCTAVGDIYHEYQIACSEPFDVEATNNFENLTVLNLRNSTLMEISFSSWPRVRYVDWSYNYLFNRSSLNGLSELVYLNVSYSHLNDLAALFTGFSSMIRLVDLSGNDQLPTSDGFWDVLNRSLLVRGTESLRMSNMNLTSIPENAFASSVNLTFLRIRDNFLRDFPKFPSTLIRLDVSNNSVEILHSETFVLNRNLTFFTADDNSNLTRIDENTFHNMENVNVISLRNNRRLTFLPRDAFSHNFHLIRLSLDGCSIKMLSFFLEPQFMDLHFLNLTGNPLECDESNRWLTELNRKIVDLSTIRCEDDKSIVDHFGQVHRLALKTLLMMGGTMMISILFIGFWFAYDIEMKRRSSNPYWRLGKNKPNPTAVYVSTTVV